MNLIDTLTLPEIGSVAVFETIKAIPGFTAICGLRVFNMPMAPMGTDVPFCLHHTEPGLGRFSAPLGAFVMPDTWTGRYVVRLICEGESAAPILPARYAIQQRFVTGRLNSLDGYFVTATLQEPWPQQLGAGSMDEEGRIYSQVGDFYELEVLNLGA
jgi:hypothetical protein